MEPSYEKNGWKSLNPMFFWSRVMKWGDKVCPEIVIKGELTQKVVDLATKHQNANFTIEDSSSTFYDPKVNNIFFRWKNRMDYIKWVDEWAKVDFLLCDRNDKVYWMQAGLCGVKVLFNYEELEEKLKNNNTLTKPERIDNWEFYKNLLTN